MYICKIIAEIEEDYIFLSEYVRKYPVKLSRTYEVDEEIPTLIIGWSCIKKRFEKQNILDKSINGNLQWGFSKTEKGDKYNIIIEKFINDSVLKWLPNDFVLLDTIFQNKSFEDLIIENINNQKRSYLYFYKNALYINNDGKDFILNVKSLELTCNDYKEKITNFINTTKCMCLSYKNISKYINLDSIGCVYTFENARWTKFSKEVNESYFNVIPDFEIKKYIPFIMSKVSNFEFSDVEFKSLKRSCIKDNITQWLSTREINLSKDFDKKEVQLTSVGESRFAKVSYSNKRTLTGRIVADCSYNPQNLDKKTEDRAKIISRFKGGKIVVFDYISFETRIALYLSENEEFISEFKNKDFHIHSAKIIFGDTNISTEKRLFAKNINHQIIYGASKKTVMQNLSSLENSEEIFYNIKQFLKPLLKKSDELLKFFKDNGYIVNLWGTIVRPKKDFASFNNLIQSSAVEIIVDQLYLIKDFLKNYKSQFLFQVHDSLVFDISPDEKSIIKKLIKLIMKYKDMSFGVSYSSGLNYKNLSTPLSIIEK